MDFSLLWLELDILFNKMIESVILNLYFSDKQKGAVPPQPKFTPKKEKDDMNKQEKNNDKKVGYKSSTIYEKKV